MAALDHRRRTGEGQHIDHAQMESALHFLAPELLDFQANGVIPRRQGNDSPVHAPHNVYPCLGDDEWIAIAVETDAQWVALRALLGSPAWSLDPTLESAAGRIERRALLDDKIAAWTATRERYPLMDALQGMGVPAGVVQRSSDLIGDPQLAHRSFFRRIQHGEMGEVPYEGHMFRIAGYDNGPRFPAPCLGQDTAEVLSEILGMSDEDVAAALAGGGVGL
jgi:benzylsuccinate CoA-transferase BbsF subunit